MHILYTLDQEMILMSDSGQFRDWRGIMAYAPVHNEFKNFLRTGKQNDYMKTLIYQWIEFKNNNIEDLQNALKLIDRLDIYEDTLECFQKDAEAYKQKKSKPLVDRNEKGAYIITTSDRQRTALNLKLVIYDAFLMYSERDEDFAALVKETLEEEFGMTICIKNDFLGGIPFEHDAAMTLIANRCRRVIIIVSKNFINCQADVFISKYAQHIGIEQSSRKIIPCLREECEIPSNLRILFHLKYYKDGKLFNFWEKLYEAVAYQGPEKDIDEDEYQLMPHKEYTPVKIPVLLPQRTPMLLPPTDTSQDEESGVAYAKHFKESECKFLGPDPPNESPNNSSVILPNKKKVKNPIKKIQKYFAKKQKQKMQA